MIFKYEKYLSLICLILLMVACQKKEQQKQCDKDEVHGVVVAQELSNSRVQCIAEDATGQLWVGTFRGLNRYDEHEYQYERYDQAVFCDPVAL